MLPVGYKAGLRAYRAAVESLSVEAMSRHYTDGLAQFRGEFIPQLKQSLQQLSGGFWDFSEFEAYAAGADTDLMAHVIEGVGGAVAYPGDWHGFRMGVSRPETVPFSHESRGRLACLCVPSVKNGQITDGMVEYLLEADACLLNINLYPTLSADERSAVAEMLLPVMNKALLSVSFSRGFGLTASQLGVLLVHRDHPLRARHHAQWEWHTYFHNAIAARAFMAMDLADVARVDAARRDEACSFLRSHGLPVVETGSYYVKSFTPAAEVPAELAPLVRDGVVRLCMKPQAT